MLEVTLNNAGLNPITHKPTLGFSATGALKRTDFLLGEFVPMVSDRVNLVIEAELEKQ